jgi:glutamine amidotransferase
MVKDNHLVAIIDFGMGNIASIQNMIKAIGGIAVVTSDPDVIDKADKLILPGVGSFDNGMSNLAARGITSILVDKVIHRRTPVLGICLGMQLMTKSSEEGVLPGLGWVDAETVRFHFGEENNNLKIPHMGWNTIRIVKENNVLFKNIGTETKYYFVHSYHLVCTNPEDVTSATFHGYEFASSFERGNIMGVQFHPEKSHKYGKNILMNFLRL